MDFYSIHDDLLELILLSVDSLVYFLRAASVCKHWRRTVTRASFLRRFRALHRPPVAGNYYNCSLRPNPSRPIRFVSSPPMNIEERHFSLDFLPDNDVRPWVWRVVGSRGTLLLLGRTADYEGSASFHDIVVCEPQTRRYQRFAPEETFNGHGVSNAYLIDGDGDGGEGGSTGMSNFMVLCMLYHGHVGVLTSDGAGHKIRDVVQMMIPLGQTDTTLYCYTGGRTMLAIDRSRVTFSSTFLLPDSENWEKQMYDIGISEMVATDGHRDGKERVVLAADVGSLKVFARKDGGREWAQEKIIQLSVVTRGLPGYKARHFRERVDICMRIQGTPMIVVSPQRKGATWRPFCLNVETLEVDDGRDRTLDTAYPCEISWPSVLRVAAQLSS